ncbi:hypothetical protein DBY21_01440 [Candidatus Gastranaerophilales bacterium]|nr:MAG: hypothetical protein DBY21_01440 [Candidatus Gastranaerophilales bacterium]
MKKHAFTLAEVLITLGIIGIVAAMTLPSLINNQRNKALQTALKKAYSRHSEALMLVKAEAGVDNLFKEFVIFDKNRGGYYRKNEFFNMYRSKLKIIGKCKYKRRIRNYSNTEDAYIDIGGTATPMTLLSDGSCMDLVLNGGNLGITFDINGADKGPNRLGHDVFTFHINKNGMWEPVKMSKLYTADELEEIKDEHTEAGISQLGYPCSIKSKQKGNGMGCAWYALNDINPDDSAERYWENLPK